TVHSYVEVHHPIQPAFRDKVPYMILLVDLDTQKGKPSEHEAIRVAGNLVTPDGEFAEPETIKSVGIGTRVRMVFKPVTEGFSLPHWTIDQDAEQPISPWRYPQE
ncbi:MAG: OB-fold domain-containing protein, partial [Rhodospirillales bacterium]